MKGAIDSHCHLEAETYGDELPAVLARAREQGVAGFVTIGSSDSLAACREAIALAERHPDVWATLGFHPHYASAADETSLTRVAELAQHPRVVALGETGLDYHYDRSPREVQRRVFARFLDMARVLAKPVVIHNRDSDADCMEIMRAERAGDIGGVVHCFSSSWDLAKLALDMGFFLGFTGIVSFKKAEEVRDVARRTPLDRIVIETDSPYLAPRPHRGRRNEPAYVVHVAEALAQALRLGVDEVIAVTSENTRRLYRL